MQQIRKTEEVVTGHPKQDSSVGKRVLHPVFGEGVVIGFARDQAGIIVQFETTVTPRTISEAAKLTYLT